MASTPPPKSSSNNATMDDTIISSVSSKSPNTNTNTNKNTTTTTTVFATSGQCFREDISNPNCRSTVDHGAPKGRNISGRSWKNFRSQKRASSLISLVPANNKSKSWEQKCKERNEHQRIKETEAQLLQQRKDRILLRKERRLENERRRAENEFKVASKSAQKLGKNVDLKLKAMNKKQLRQIKKTRMNNKTGVVEYVSAYAK